MADAEERLALIELLERDGRVRQQIDVRRWPLSIGRGLDADVVLDDPHVAPRHARIAADDAGRLWLEVGDTRNGVRIGRRALGAGERVALDTLPRENWQLGLARLRVRLAGEALPPERPLVAQAGATATAVFTLALWALLIAQHWVEADPDAGLPVWLPVLLGPPVAMAIWCAAWATASKLFQHRFEFGGHWALAVRWLLALVLGSHLLTLAAPALGWPALFRLTGPYEAAVLAGGLFLHLRQVLPAQTRALALALSAGYVAAGAVLVALNLQREQPPVGPLYMHALPQPQWRLARPHTPERFVERSRALKAVLDARAKSEPDEGDTPAQDSDEE